jgi:ribonuclease HI
VLQIYFDGACGPVNPGGKAGWGWIAYRDGKVVSQEYGYVGEGPEMSNNVAEYSAILAALIWAKSFDEPVEFRGDSMLVIRQMSGQWKIKRGLYEKYARDAWRFRRSNHRYTWIPRELNSVADELSNLGMNCEGEKFGVDKEYQDRMVREYGA